MEDEERNPIDVGNEIMERTKMAEKVAYPTRRKLTRGTESAKGTNVKALTWKCPKCGRVNRPERRLLATLPVIICSCGEESTIQFDFSLHKMEVNGHFLIPIIRKQNPKECCICSMLALGEISWRVNAIINGQILEDSEPFLDRDDLLEKYNYLCDICGIEKRFNQTAVQTLLEIFSTIGVQSDPSKVEDGGGTEASKINEVGFELEASNPKKAPPKLYVLPFYSAVKKDFNAICRLLGDGYVIRTSFYTGKGFGKLKPGKIYKSPGRGRIRHAIILVGAGRRGKTKYYHLLNSWGKEFCLRVLKRGIRVGRPRLQLPRRFRNIEKARGGFGLLRASDIVTRPVTFLRHKDDYTYYKSLLLKDIIPPGKTKGGPEAASITTSWEATQSSNTCSRNSELRKSGANEFKEKALAQSKEGEASRSAKSGVASFKAPGGTHRSSFEHKSNSASALYGAYEGSSSQGSSSCYGDHMAPPSDLVALMEFYAKKAAQEERKRLPRQSKDEIPPPPSLQGPPKKGHHMGDFIPPEEFEKIIARCNDAAAQKVTKEAAEKAKTDNIGHKLLSKMGWKEAQKATKEVAEKAKIQEDNIGAELLSKMWRQEGNLLKESNEQEKKSGSHCKLIKKYEGFPINPSGTEILRVS